MAKLIPPHGGKGLTCCLLEGAELEAEKKKAEGLKRISISPREKGDLIMMGIFRTVVGCPRFPLISSPAFII